tara:strand:- start:19589 stop:20692 length:1104 start_codon:yes stop_codon:yes gene_type:complete
MLGIFFFLPSPVIPPHQREAYIQRRFASGNTVITNIDYIPFRRDPKFVYSGECSECSDLLIHWRLVASGRDFLLRTAYYDEYPGVNMTRHLQEAIDWNDDVKAGSAKNWTPYFSEPIEFAGIPSGSLDEEINMPWFTLVDQRLTHYNMHNLQASFVAHAVMPRPGILEIWRGAYVKSALNATEHVQKFEDDKPSQNMLRWMVYDNMLLHQKDTDFLASFQFVATFEQTRVVVKHLAGDLPSRTYPIRRALLVPLGPFIAIPFILATALLALFTPLVYFVFAWFGFLVGLVAIRRMLDRAPVTSYCDGLWWPLQWLRHRRRNSSSRRKHVWGPSGPVALKTHSKWFDEEKGIGLQRPENMRTGKDWKD